MAPKKKTRKKSSRSHKAAGRKVTPAKKQAGKGKTPKKSAKRAAAPRKAVAKKKPLKKKLQKKTTAGRKTASVSTKKTSKTRPGRRELAFSSEVPESRSGAQSGDLQGLSNVENVDSESVDELLEEGNAFEAGVVSGVQDAGAHSEREVHTREVPEDDVPGEYLDED
jgi:hypothetical protein